MSRENITLPAERLIIKNMRAVKNGPAFFYMPQIRGSLKIYPGVFNPALTNVSPLFAKYLKVKRRGEKVLEIGTGSGFISVLLAQQGAKVVATDVSKIAVRCATENAKLFNLPISVLRGSLFNPVKKMKFDSIVFNPPLVPVACNRNKTRVELALVRAIFDPNMKLLRRFFKNARMHLKDNGRIILIYTDLSNRPVLSKKSNFKKICSEYQFSCRGLGHKTFHGETYTVYEIKKIVHKV